MDSPIPDYLDRILYPLVGHRMLELGRKKTDEISYKSYFESLGIDHTSIDIKGGYGSLALDLTKPLDLEPFDMITNLGTTEHVSRQPPVWENIHNLLKPNGVLVSMTPLKGNWWWHGEWYPTEDFYQSFAHLNGYIIEFMGIGREYPFQNIDVRMRKEANDKFIMPSMDLIYRNKIRPR